MSDRLPTLQEAIATAIEHASQYLYTCIPAKVVKWDASKQRANCQVLIKDFYEDEEGERQMATFPVVPGVPVQFMGAGEYRMTVPIGDGSNGTAQTLGTLFFSHRSLDKWLTGDGKEVDPEYDHIHGPMDAIFIPGLKPFGAPWSDVPSEGMSIGKDGGLQATFTDDLITMAETAASAQFVAQANKVQQWLDAFNAAINAWTVVPQDGGAALKAALATLVAGTPSTDVAASKVKAE